MIRIYPVQCLVTRDLKVVFIPPQKVFDTPSAGLPTLLQGGRKLTGYPSSRGEKDILGACKSD
jgi:hypothetical protein